MGVTEGAKLGLLELRWLGSLDEACVGAVELSYAGMAEGSKEIIVGECAGTFEGSVDEAEGDSEMDADTADGYIVGISVKIVGPDIGATEDSNIETKEGRTVGLIEWIENEIIEGANVGFNEGLKVCSIEGTVLDNTDGKWLG